MNTKDVIEQIEVEMKELKLSFQQMNNFWSYVFDMDDEGMLEVWEWKKEVLEE